MVYIIFQVFGLLGDLSEMYKDIFVSVISAQRDELWQAQLCETTANLGSYLKDFDWKLKVSVILFAFVML